MSETVTEQPVKDLEIPADLFLLQTRRLLHGYIQTNVSAALESLMVYGATQTAAAYPMDMPTMTAKVRESEAAERRAVAASFVAHVQGLDYVREVWFEDSTEMAKITTIVGETSLDEELQLEAALTTVLQAHPSRFDGFLRVYSEADGVPDFARSGEQLLP